MSRHVSISSMRLRQQWLEKLGGLDGVSVRNKEWLNLLEEDTRQSLMIEGVFVDRRELKEIIENRTGGDIAQKVLGYFDAAVSSYEFAFQQYQTGEFCLSKALIRQIHAMMFRTHSTFPYTPGEWRKGAMQITGAKITPLQSERIDTEIDKLVVAINTLDASPVRKAAIAHAVFEQIHPFPDGNGRTGRILMNFILVASGLPNVAIKGEMEDERNEYITTLENADTNVSEVLGGRMSYGKLLQHPPIALEDLINKNLAVALDTVICGRFEQRMGTPLIPIDDAAEALNKNPDSFRVACSQKKIICYKVKGRLVTHPLLNEIP